MTPLAHLAWAKALPVSVKPGQLPSALREAADEKDRMSEKEVALRREAAWRFWERRKRMMDAGWQVLPPMPGGRCPRVRAVTSARGRIMSGSSRHTSSPSWDQTRICGCSRRTRARTAASAGGRVLHHRRCSVRRARRTRSSRLISNSGFPLSGSCPQEAMRKRANRGSRGPPLPCGGAALGRTPTFYSERPEVARPTRKCRLHSWPRPRRRRSPCVMPGQARA